MTTLTVKSKDDFFKGKLVILISNDIVDSNDNDRLLNDFISSISDIYDIKIVKTRESLR